MGLRNKRKEYQFLRHPLQVSIQMRMKLRGSNLLLWIKQIPLQDISTVLLDNGGRDGAIPRQKCLTCPVKPAT